VAQVVAFSIFHDQLKCKHALEVGNLIATHTLELGRVVYAGLEERRQELELAFACIHLVLLDRAGSLHKLLKLRLLTRLGWLFFLRLWRGTVWDLQVRLSGEGVDQSGVLRGQRTHFN